MPQSWHCTSGYSTCWINCHINFHSHHCNFNVLVGNVWTHHCTKRTQQIQYATFDILRAVLLKFQVCWDVTSCQLVNTYWHTERVQCLQNISNHLPTNTVWHTNDLIHIKTIMALLHNTDIYVKTMLVSQQNNKTNIHTLHYSSQATNHTLVYFGWVWNFVFHTQQITKTLRVWEQGDEKNYTAS